MIGVEMKFEKIEMDPRKNPAILDTATWETASAWDTVSAVDESHWNSALQAVRDGRPFPVDKHCVVYAGSCAEYRAGKFFLAGLVDGQQVFIQLGTDSKDTILGEPIGSRSLENGTHLAVYRTDAETIDRYVTLIKPDRGPKALGAIPRLGIGSRM